MKKRKILILLIIFTLLFITGCSNEKEYNKNGISITMTKGLFYKAHPNATIYYENDEMFFIGLEEKFEDLMELDINNETTIAQYAQEVFINREESFELIKDENIFYYTYEYEINDTTFYYISSIHKSNKGFWICNFACKQKDKEKYHNLFIKWAKTIKFD